MCLTVTLEIVSKFYNTLKFSSFLSIKNIRNTLCTAKRTLTWKRNLSRSGSKKCDYKCRYKSYCKQSGIRAQKLSNFVFTFSWKWGFELQQREGLMLSLNYKFRHCSLQLYCDYCRLASERLTCCYQYIPTVSKCPNRSIAVALREGTTKIKI